MNEPVTRVKDHALWQTESPYYWPGEKYSLGFYGYAPSEAEVEVGCTSQGTVTYTYTVPANIDEQKDLVLARASYSDANSLYPGTYNSVVDLNFQHALTAVRFKAGRYFDVDIAKIGFEAYPTGTFKYDESGNLVCTASGQLTLFEVTELDKSVIGEYITPEDKTFLMIPQEMDGKRIRIIYIEDGVEKTADIINFPNPASWEPGKVNTYILNRFMNTNKLIITSEKFDMDENWSWDVTQGDASGPEPMVPDPDLEW